MEKKFLKRFDLVKSKFKKNLKDNIFKQEIEKFTMWLNDFQVTDYTGKSASLITLQSEKEWLESASKNTDDRIFNIIEINFFFFQTFVNDMFAEIFNFFN